MSVRGKGRGSSFQERVSHTYTLRLEYSIIFIMYQKKKKKNSCIYTNTQCKKEQPQLELNFLLL